jgi:glutamate/tyrosine decarboxylase-like PLP-dependent enzyme
VTVERALRLLGIGRSSVARVAADDQGRMLADAFRAELGKHTGPTIVCVQAGEVNTGSFDPLTEIVPAAREAGAWVHVDGAFGLWAAATPLLRHLVAGAELADSWSADAHKWLNVPYDSGVAFCRHPAAHRAAMSAGAEYLIHDESGLRDQMDWTPEFSRRARGFATYAALRSLGRRGVAELVERCCEHARRLADGLVELLGVELLNDVVLNQVLFRLESDERTDEVLRRVQESGEVWMSGTVWNGRKAIRLSVSNWQTSDADVDRALEAFFAAVGQPPRSAASRARARSTEGKISFRS